MITYAPQTESKASFSTIVLPFFKAQIDHDLIAQASGIRAKVDFEANSKEVSILYHPSGERKVYLLGLGEERSFANCAQAFRSLAFKHHQNWSDTLSLHLAHLPKAVITQAVLGIQLATYNIGLYKTKAPSKVQWGDNDVRIAVIHTDAENAKLTHEAQQIANTQINMMRLVDQPANKKTPEDIANYALQSAQTHGYSTQVFYKAELEAKGLATILAVGMGSHNPPVMIIMEYNGLGADSVKPQLGLVGKGITFDTGGISMKGPANMHYMKSDMGGAAAVLGAVEAAARLKLPIHIVGIIPSAENSVDALSVKPGDVIGSYSGKTIEVIDTDAEGRLVLADGLAYMCKHYEPAVLIDLATLTGSCVRALGYAAAGLFSHNDELAQDISQAGFAAHERVWRLPLWEDYEPDIQSDIADVKNFSGKPIAGAISAAKFLEVFTNEHPQWAHLDIAGVAFGDSEFNKMKSASGYGVRLLLAYMQTIIKQAAA